LTSEPFPGEVFVKTNRELVVAIALDWLQTEKLGAPDANGVEWTEAGLNSTHYFYLGVDAEDRLWAKAGSMDVPKGTSGKPEYPGDGASEEVRDAYHKATNDWYRRNETWVESDPRIVPPGGQAWLGRGAYVVALGKEAK
jgi:hypothetical protein